MFASSQVVLLVRSNSRAIIHVSNIIVILGVSFSQDYSIIPRTDDYRSISDSEQVPQRVRKRQGEETQNNNVIEMAFSYLICKKSRSSVPQADRSKIHLSNAYFSSITTGRHSSTSRRQTRGDAHKIGSIAVMDPEETMRFDRPTTLYSIEYEVEGQKIAAKRSFSEFIHIWNQVFSCLVSSFIITRS